MKVKIVPIEYSMFDFRVRKNLCEVFELRKGSISAALHTISLDEFSELSKDWQCFIL
ncbi:MAG: hypothetical protein AB7F59_05710 [Bdellovibrionales bacterium]